MAKAKHDADLNVVLSKQEWDRAANMCEEYELDFASSSEPSNSNNIPNYGIHLIIYYFTNNLNNARFLWKRIPVSVKSSKPEYAAIWAIGKSLWARDYPAIYKSLTAFNFTEPHKGLITLFQANFRQHTFQLLSRAYTAIGVDDAAIFLGLPVADTVKLATQHGWAHDSKSNVFTPKVSSENKNQGTGLPQLQQLTDYFTFCNSDILKLILLPSYYILDLFLVFFA